MLTNAPLLHGGAQFCFPALSRAPCLLCLPEGLNSYVLTNAPRLGGAQFCFPVLSRAPSLLCLPEGPNSYVLAKAPRLCVSIWIGPNSVVVLTNAQVSAWRVQSGMCSPMHRFCLEGPNSVFLCSVVHLVCCVCRRVPTPMCSLLYHVFSVSVWIGPMTVLVLNNAPRL